MPLCLRNKSIPNIEVRPRPLIWTGIEDVVGKDIVVSERRNNWDHEIVGRIGVVDVIWLSKSLYKLGDNEPVKLEDLLV